jgi:paraquat-inducible protein A
VSIPARGIRRNDHVSDISGIPLKEAWSAAAAGEALTPARLRECHDCGHFQIVPSMEPGTSARCLRCNAVLRRTHHHSLARALALNVTAMTLLVISLCTSLMTVSSFGMYRTATMLSGPQGMESYGVWELALAVGFMTILAPLIRLALVTYVLTGLRMAHPPRHLRTAFRWAQHLRPWAMIEVYLLGVFVAYTEMPSMVHIDIGVSVWALIALMLIIVISDVVLDRQLVWEEMERRGIPDVAVDHAAIALTGLRRGAVGCHACGQVSLPRPGVRVHCPRCGSALEHRRANAITRCWALALAAAVLYIPANMLPVMTFTQLGSGSSHTIIGGAEELLNAGLWPLALLVFLASIVVPCLKLLGLGLLMVTTQRRSGWQLRERTVVYRVVNVIGRWSMIDIFMASILIALVQFGAVITIGPGLGAVAFAGVVILTMIAAEGFDPRLMWDSAGRNRAATSD